MANMGTMHFWLRISNRPGNNSSNTGYLSRFDNIFDSGLVVGDGGTYMFPTMYSSWGWFGCARADGVG